MVEFNLKKNYIFLFYIIIILIITSYKTIADDIYPSSYKNIDLYEGGELFILNNNNKINSIFIKPNWAEAEILQYWNGILKNNTRTKSFSGNRYVLSAFPINNIFLILYKENGKLFLSVTDNKLSDFNIDLEINYPYLNYLQTEIKWIGQIDNDYLLLLINDYLYKIKYSNPLNYEIISDRVTNSLIINKLDSFNCDLQNSNLIFTYFTNKDIGGFINFVKKNGEVYTSERLDVYDIVNLYQIKDKIGILTSTKSNTQSFFQIVDSSGKIRFAQWLETQYNRVQIICDSNLYKIIFIKLQNKGNILVINDYNYNNELLNTKSIPISEYFTEPTALFTKNDSIYVIFRNGLICFNINGDIISADNYPFGEYDFKPSRISFFMDTLILTSNNNTFIFKRDDNQLWFFNNFLRTKGVFIIPFLVSILFIIIIQLYRHQRRLLFTILELPSLGAIFFIDKNGRMQRVNNTAMKILGINKTVPLYKQYNYYFVAEHTKQLKELIDKALFTRAEFSQKLNIIIGNESRDFSCRVVCIRNIAGQFKGIVFTAQDITEDLEKARLSSWAKLAHDMQTNLTTIRLNAEHLDLIEKENTERKRKIIHQTSLLINRVRDIVTVGRSEGIERTNSLSDEICNSVVNEFDLNIFSNIEFILNIQTFEVSCDKQKMIRALRNAIENAIRAFQGHSGIITISAWFDFRDVYFSIKDNGPGMDDTLKINILKPYFTTSKKHGGTGIGTMIMQHVMDLHGGEIIINSEKGKGTEVVFKFPNYIRGKRKN